MSTSGFSIFSSIFGFVAAAITLITYVVTICRSHLPSNKIKELESLMDETETRFKKTVEDGLLIEPELFRTECHLTMLRTLTYRLQCRAYNATTFRQDCLEFLRGTSKSIGGACRSLRRLRTQLVTSSERRLCRLTKMNQVPPSSPALPLIADPECYPSPLPSVQIRRPRSCPPVLSRWRLDDAQYGFAQGDPLHDPMRSDSDVRTTDAHISESTIHTSVTLEPGA